jgi:hypothetical protein
MNCSFDVEKCNPDCRNFGFCAYLNIQNQINSLQGQLNTLFSVMTDSVKTTADLKDKINNLETNSVSKKIKRKNRKA